MPSKSEVWAVSSRAIIRAFAICSWALVVSFKSPIWERDPLSPSIFTMDTLIVQVFWIFLVAVQGLYLCLSVRTMEQLLRVSLLFEAHFAAHNVLHVVFATLVRQSEFRLAEVALVLDLLNLVASYVCRHSISEPTEWLRRITVRPISMSIQLRLDHASLVTGPLSWVIVAIYWNGAMMIPQRESLAAGVFGNVCIWGLLGVGLFYGIVYNDHSMAMFLSVLSAAIGVGQYRLMDGSSGLEHSMQHIPLIVQCSSAFVIMTLLFLFTLARLLAKWWREGRKSARGWEPEQENNLSTSKSTVDIEVMAEKPRYDGGSMDNK